eukprot:1804904-Prymnesium_polylepis.1
MIVVDARGVIAGAPTAAAWRKHSAPKARASNIEHTAMPNLTLPMLGRIERCWARCGSTAGSNPLVESGRPLELAFSTAMVERGVSVYGHIWDVLDAFFLCVVGPRLRAHAKACPP